jgi:hypothetical protein
VRNDCGADPADTVVAGHAFDQNSRRGHYNLAATGDAARRDYILSMRGTAVDPW